MFCHSILLITVTALFEEIKNKYLQHVLSQSTLPTDKYFFLKSKTRVNKYTSNILIIGTLLQGVSFISKN